MELIMRLCVPESGLIDGTFNIWSEDDEGYEEPNYVYNSTMMDRTKSIPVDDGDPEITDIEQEASFFG